MQVKTITTVAGVNEIDFGNDSSQSTAHFYWFKNLGDSALYVSANPNPIAEKDDVAELPAKGAVSVETDEGIIYVLGAGKVEIHRTDSKFCPFDWQSSGSGGGGGGSITVDSELSDTSTNPLQNKVTTAAINEVNSALETKSDINHIHDISASGNPVIMDNLQGGVPFSEMVVSGKNLLQKMVDKSIGGLHYSPNDDGSVSVTGTQTAENYPSITSVSGMLLKSGKYTLSGGTGRLQITALDIDANTVIARAKIAPATFSIDTDKYIRIYVYSASTYNDQTFDDVVYPQLELGDAATGYEPPIIGRELQVNASGKNLLKYPYYNTTQTQNGVTFTDNGDGSITVNGTATATAYFSLSSNEALPTGKYVLGKSMGNILLYVDKYLDNAFYQRLATSTGTIKELIFNVPEDDAQKYTYKFGIQINKGNTGDNVTIYPQLELGDTATEYEPYHGSTTAIRPTSNPYTVPDSIGQQKGYNVVSVSEGELSVVGVQKNAAIKRIWDDMSMDLLFDGVTSTDNPAVVDLANYKFVEICHTMTANEKTYPTNIRLSLDSYLSSASTIITPIHGSSINTTHTEEGMVSSLYAISAAGSNMNNTKIYGIK